MRKSVALLLGVLVPLLGLAGVGNAQSNEQIQGTIAAVDCQAQTLAVAGPDTTIAVAPYTAVLVNSNAVSLCDLQQYIGSPVTVWLVASGNGFVATRIDATPHVAADPLPAPAQPSINPLPILGIVLGTIVVAGLVYLLVHNNGSYYRYPYYGSYHAYYYRPGFQPYLGWYPAVLPIVFAPAPITGFVLGITVVSGFNYLIVRERDGHFARYPYYGPYRDYYYRPEYRAYTGQYHDIPVHYGEWRNNAPSGAPRQPDNGRPNYAPGPQRPNYDYNRGPAQYQEPRPSYNHNPGNGNNRPQQYQQEPRPSYNSNPGNGNNRPQQYQQEPRPSYNSNPGTGNNRGPQQYQEPRPSYNSNPGNGHNRGPQQYEQSPRPSDNYNPGNGHNRGPQQYQQPPRPNYNDNGGYNRGGGYGGGRGQSTRGNCNSREDSCSNR